MNWTTGFGLFRFCIGRPSRRRTEIWSYTKHRESSQHFPVLGADFYRFFIFLWGVQALRRHSLRVQLLLLYTITRRMLHAPWLLGGFSVALEERLQVRLHWIWKHQNFDQNLLPRTLGFRCCCEWISLSSPSCGVFVIWLSDACQSPPTLNKCLWIKVEENTEIEPRTRGLSVVSTSATFCFLFVD